VRGILFVMALTDTEIQGLEERAKEIRATIIEMLVSARVKKGQS